MAKTKASARRKPKGRSSAEKRGSGMHQVESTRESILAAAERLFLERGLENTRMIDIAEAAEITKVTLYRYFPDRHPLAFAVAQRVLLRIGIAATPPNPESLGLGELLKQYFVRIIDSYPGLVDSFRYLDLFDHLYSEGYPDAALAREYKANIERAIVRAFRAAGPGEPSGGPSGGDEAAAGRSSPAFPLAVATINAIASFLEKMASRGALLGAEQGVNQALQLAAFKAMITTWFDVGIAPLLEPRHGE
jgi:AcrR family transcriptional regulator